MAMWEGIDKRGFPRARHKCLIRVVDNGKEDVIDAYTENIGGGGICAGLGKAIGLFKNVKLNLYLSKDDPAILCGGTVMWVVRRSLGPRSDSYEYDTGIEFTDISEEDRGKIADRVNDILSSELDNRVST